MLACSVRATAPSSSRSWEKVVSGLAKAELLETVEQEERDTQNSRFGTRQASALLKHIHLLGSHLDASHCLSQAPYVWRWTGGDTQ